MEKVTDNNIETTFKLNTNNPQPKSLLATVSKNSNIQQNTQNILQQREKNKRNNDYNIIAKKLLIQNSKLQNQKTLFNIKRTNQQINNNMTIKNKIFNKKNKNNHYLDKK